MQAVYGLDSYTHKSKSQGLEDYGEPKWDQKRARTTAVAEVLTSGGLDVWGTRMHSCTTWLEFSDLADITTGEMHLRLNRTNFCRNKHCPVCTWRRVRAWRARLAEALPLAQEAHPSGAWLFLTLTVRNCPVEELGATLDHMGKAWGKITRRAFFAPVLGWFRSTEVTRGEDGTAHPHFHVLLFVPRSMLSGRGYVPQREWVRQWQTALKADYSPVVDIRRVRDRRTPENGSEGHHRAILEAAKYTVKDVEADNDPEWFLSYVGQMFGRRTYAAGGLLRELLRDDDPDTDEMTRAGEVDEEGLLELRRLVFWWTGQRYQERAGGH